MHGHVTYRIEMHAKVPIELGGREGMRRLLPNSPVGPGPLLFYGRREDSADALLFYYSRPFPL